MDIPDNYRKCTQSTKLDCPCISYLLIYFCRAQQITQSKRGSSEHYCSSFSSFFDRSLPCPSSVAHHFVCEEPESEILPHVCVWYGYEGASTLISGVVCVCVCVVWCVGGCVLCIVSTVRNGSCVSLIVQWDETSSLCLFLMVQRPSNWKETQI